MSNVTKFPGGEQPPEQPNILICDCGSTTWFHFSDGSIQCANCDEEGEESGVWYNRLPPADPIVKDEPEAAFKIVRMSSTQTNLLFVLDELKRDAEQICGLMTIYRNGYLRTFQDVETPEQLRYLRKRFRMGLGMIYNRFRHWQVVKRNMPKEE